MSQVAIIRGDALIAQGRALEVIEALLAIDRLVYGDMGAKDTMSAEGWLRHWTARPDIQHVCFVEGQVAGNLHIVPLAAGARDRIISGQLGDGEFGDADVAPRGLGPDGLYVLSLVLAPHLQGRGLARLLWNRAAAYWRSHGENRRLLATVWSADGARFFGPLLDRDLGTDPAGHRLFQLKPMFDYPGKVPEVRCDVRVFQQRELPAAYAYAGEGGQAVHLMAERFAHLRSDTPSCFKGRGQVAHFFDQDKARLVATAKRLGVRVIRVEREGTPRQHIDLCGGPLAKALALASAHEKAPGLLPGL